MFNKMKRIQPEPGQESVWDYPRPPRLADTDRHVEIVVNGRTIAETHRAKRILETSHPPVYYLPPEDIQMDLLRPAPGKTWCEFKGQASYYDLVVGDREIRRAAWFYPNPSPGYEGIQYYVAFYPSKMDRCTVDGELVAAQEGDFYGGWITSEIVGPFKGGPGTMGW